MEDDDYDAYQSIIDKLFQPTSSAWRTTLDLQDVETAEKYISTHVLRMEDDASEAKNSGINSEFQPTSSAWRTTG